MRAKMDAAVTLAKVAGNTRVDWALGHAAVNGRFGWRDLASILGARPPTLTIRATESPARCPKAPAAGPRSPRPYPPASTAIP